jgi:hypothetical protein
VAILILGTLGLLAIKINNRISYHVSQGGQRTVATVTLTTLPLVYLGTWAIQQLKETTLFVVYYPRNQRQVNTQQHLL